VHTVDPHRPQYHFLPPANWMNDPNGLICWEGSYHLFYQYNPYSAEHGSIHWGHAVSTDLVHWRDLPIALRPTPGGPDADGCWSGCAVDDDGTPTFVYTGFAGGRQRPCLATSDDGLLTWRTYAGNPVIAEPPDGLDVVGFRDHSLWRSNGLWRHVIGSGIRGVGGAALSYRSSNLVDWEYTGPLLTADQVRDPALPAGDMWECPDFFGLGDRHVLAVSVCGNGGLHHPVGLIGTYEAENFQVESVQPLDPGGHFYAPQSFFDGTGRRVMFGWLREGRPVADQVAAGWSGAMSLPRVLTLDADGRLRTTPAPELTALRRAGDEAVGSGRVRLPVAQTEIRATFDVGPRSQAGVVIHHSRTQSTRVVYDAVDRRLRIEGPQSQAGDGTGDGSGLADGSELGEGDPCEHDLEVGPSEPLVLRIFVDHSVVEVYACDRAVLTERVYPGWDEEQGLATYANGAARVTDVAYWPLDTAFADRLTTTHAGDSESTG
jgi:beta-fructofuranosidase